MLTKGGLCLTDETQSPPAGLSAFLTRPAGGSQGPALLWKVPCFPVLCAWTHIKDLVRQLLCHSRGVPGPSLSSQAPRQGLVTHFHGAPRECLGSRQRSCSKSHTRSFCLGSQPCAPWSGARGQSQASSPKPLRISGGLRPGTTLRTTHCPPKPSGGPGPALLQLPSSTGQSLGWTCRRDSQVEVTGPSFGTLSAES